MYETSGFVGQEQALYQAVAATEQQLQQMQVGLINLTLQKGIKSIFHKLCKHPLPVGLQGETCCGKYTGKPSCAVGQEQALQENAAAVPKAAAGAGWN